MPPIREVLLEDIDLVTHSAVHIAGRRGNELPPTEQHEQFDKRLTDEAPL
jgi:hypothetical protein